MTDQRTIDHEAGITCLPTEELNAILEAREALQHRLETAEQRLEAALDVEDEDPVVLPGKLSLAMVIVVSVLAFVAGVGLWMIVNRGCLCL